MIGLANRTLQSDDVRLARRLLRRPDSWVDPAAVHQYEADFRTHVVDGDVTAWASARVALSAALAAARLPTGSDVLLPGYTCVVVANAVRFAGLNPVFVDIELETFGPSMTSVIERATPSATAIIVQHLYGLVARDYEAILDFSRDRGLVVIDDCSQATGARFLDEPLGSLSDVAIYSSEQSKVFSTIQGGTAVAFREELSERLREQWHSSRPSGRGFTEALLHNVELAYMESAHPLREFTGPWARRRWGRWRLISTTSEEERGIRPAHYGRRMSAPVAALGSQQLGRLAENNQRRRTNSARWAAWAEDHGHQPPVVIDRSEPVFLRYPVLVSTEMKRDLSWGRELGVDIGMWFRSQLHPAPGLIASCPNGIAAVDRCINFPTL